MHFFLAIFSIFLLFFSITEETAFFITLYNKDEIFILLGERKKKCSQNQSVQIQCHWILSFYLTKLLVIRSAVLYNPLKNLKKFGKPRSLKANSVDRQAITNGSFQGEKNSVSWKFDQSVNIPEILLLM